MHFITRRAGALGLALIASTCAHAADGVRPVIGMDLTFGGDTLVTVNYTNGDSKDIQAGGLAHVFAGAEYQSGSFALQGTVGFHRDTTVANNGGVTFTRVPLELLGLWNVGEQLRVGGGLRKATVAKVRSSGAAASLGSARFDSTLGLVLQGEYLFMDRQLSVFARYVSETYELGPARADGNHVGLGVSYRF